MPVTNSTRKPVEKQKPVIDIPAEPIKINEPVSESNNDAEKTEPVVQKPPKPNFKKK